MDIARQNEALERTLVALRRALAALHRGDEDIDNPLDTSLIERADELADGKDELTRALHDWLAALRLERDFWDDRVALARAWREERVIPGLDAPVSLRDLRARVLCERVPGLRDQNARAFTEVAGAAADLAVSSLVRRLDREGARFLVADDNPELAPRAAKLLLARTEDMAEELPKNGWSSGFHATIGADAQEGWPARLTSRWLGSVFAGPRLLDGLRLEPPTLPRPWGATSFARALGALGVSIMEAGRPRALPRSLHQRPRGVRRHQRFALFASLVGEPSFATRVLGLGRDRALVHRRAVARAFCGALRIAAERVELAAALVEGEASARDRHADLTQRLFGQSAPRTLFGALPLLRSADGAALVGTILAVGERDELVHAHDEDWYRNPRVAEVLRSADQRPFGEPPAPDSVDAAVERLGTLLEAAIG